jgi:hypothetical protein
MNWAIGWAVDKVACGVENVENGIAAFRHSLNDTLEPQYFEQMAHSEPAAAWGIAGGVLTAVAGLYALYKTTPYWLEAPFHLADTLFKPKRAPNTPL